MNTLITYDVSAKHAQVKAAMKAIGYFDSWTSNNTTYWLPNTTLWKSNTETEQALRDLQRVVTQLGVALERAIAVPSSPWHGLPGIPHVG